MEGDIEASGSREADVSGAEGAESSSQGAAPDVPEWMKAKHKVDLDGEELEVDYEEMRKGYQRAQAANKRFLEAKRLREEASQDTDKIKQLFALAKDDPDILLEALGVEPLTYAERRLLKQIDEEKKSPAQQEAEKWERIAEQRRREAEKYDAEQRSRAEQQATEKWVAHFTNIVDQTIEKAGFTKSQLNTSRVGKYIEIALANEMEPDIDDMAQSLIEDYGSEHKALYGSLPGEQLAKLLGEDGLKKLREYDMGRLKSEKSFGGGRKSEADDTEKPIKKEMSFSDYMEQVKRKNGISP
jgi:hypothetical protein